MNRPTQTHALFRMSRKAALGPQNMEWVIALAIIAVAFSLYNQKTTEKKDVLVEYNTQDAAALAQQRTLQQLLREPVLYQGRTLPFSEFLAYRELDEHYDSVILNTLSKYAPHTQLTLQSGSNTVAQYGKTPSTSTAAKAQIPSFSGKPLFVTLTFSEAS